MLNDLRYAFRALRHKPGFALTAIVSIAIGIGANASIFSLVDGILLRPLPVPSASEVVTLASRTPSGTLGGMSWRDYLDFSGRNRSFSGLVAYESANLGFSADSLAQPRLEPGVLVSANFFDVLEIKPRLGRWFRPEEGQAPGRDPVMVVGYDFWKKEFDSDASVIGRHVWLNGLNFTVVGVAPEAFKGIAEFSLPAFYIPAMMGPALVASNHALPTDRSIRVFTLKGRLKRGVPIQAADTEASALAQALEQTNPGTNRAFGAAVRTERQSRMDIAPGRAIVPGLLFGFVAVLLAIACANVANLALSRGRSRTREIAVRLALGASRLRLLRQLMAENLLIASGGGALGLLMARFFAQAASTLQLPGDVPIELSFQLDARVVWFTAAVSMASALLFGLAPAFQSIKTDLVPALKTGEADQTRQRRFGRSSLVVVQIAGSLVLLALGAQLFRGFSRVLALSPGFRRDHVLTMSFDPSLIRYSGDRTRQFFDELTQRARGIAGVRSASLASTPPMSTSPRMESVVPEGYRFPRGQESANVWADAVDDAYFDTLAVPMIRGRGFLASDKPGSPPVAVVNEAFASRYLGNHPIGKRVRLAGPSSPWIEIVGVTVTGKYLSAIEPPINALYLPYCQHPASRMTLLVQTEGDPAAFAAPLRDVVRSIDPNMPVFGVRTMSDFFEQRSVKAGDLIVGTVGLIGLLGLALALVGLYAVVAYQVAGRTREIGIRLAIGADRSRVMVMILRQAARMSVTGVLIGLALSLVIGRALNGELLILDFNPALYALLTAGLLATTLLAAALPARRAARVDPMQALRQD